jgi:hypothetical protein
MAEPPEIDSAEQQKEFFWLLGIAMTVWAQLDEQLFRTCAQILKAAEHHAAIVYYRTPTLDARLTLVDELVQTIFPGRKAGAHPHPSEKVWAAIGKEIRDELPIRNRLAHSPAASHGGRFVPPEGGPPEFRSWFASYVSPTEKLRGRDKRGPEYLKRQDVRAHIGRIAELTKRLRNIRQHELSELLK